MMERCVHLHETVVVCVAETLAVHWLRVDKSLAWQHGLEVGIAGADYQMDIRAFLCSWTGFAKSPASKRYNVENHRDGFPPEQNLRSYLTE